MTAKRKKAASNDTEFVDAIDSGKAQRGSGSATGQEAARREGAEDELPSGDDKGSTLESKVPVPAADYLGEGQAPIGKQAEPASFVGNGQINTSMVASPSGPVPISSVVFSPEEAEKLEEKTAATFKKEHTRSRGRRLTEAQVNAMNGAELRAVATDRGYGATPGNPTAGISSLAGTRSTRAMFLRWQDEDKFLDDGEDIPADATS